MRVLAPAARLFLAVTIACIGCGAPAAQSPSSARIAPIDKNIDEGTLVVAVLGYPRDIEYRVNGTRIQTDEPIAWWADARLELQLESGTYRVEGTYRVRAWSGDKTTARVETPTPVPIKTGATTYLLGELAKDWRGVPAAAVTPVRVVDAATFERTVAAARPTAPEAAESAATAAEGVTILRGTPEGVQTETGPAANDDSNSIVIRGNQVLPPGTPESQPPAAEAATTVPVPATDATQGAATDSTGLPSSAGPETQALLSPGASAPHTLTVRLESDPSGARAFVDDADVGVTPIEVRIEPTVDHVIRFERAGCSDHVRFLSAAGWETGRSTRIVARLECQ